MRILTLIRNDLLQEWRTKESLAFSLSLPLLFSTVIGVGINNAMVNPLITARLFPSLLWIVFVFTATITIGRSIDNDTEHSAIERLLLLGVDSFELFAAKLLSNAIIMITSVAMCILSMSVLLNVAIAHRIGELLLVSLLVVIGYSALVTLTVAISNGSKLKSLLLPLLLIPLLFPLFFAASELTASIFISENFELGSGWLSLLIGLDVLYSLIGMNLYQFVIRE